MRKAAAVLLIFLLCSIGAGQSADLSDSDIRAVLIHQSIAAYPGNCPCPYSVNRAGRRCGATSAYSKPGGRSPLCYPQDVTEQMIERFRQQS